ncbi:MAG TPA: hypothetical protein VGG74_30835 [Kofleriaceae bacterium]|jgi:hypothetical protein
MSNLTTLDGEQLDTVSGGFDFNAMLDAGNGTATRALAAGGFLGTGGKAIQNAMTADGLKLTLEHGRAIAALAGGVGAAGWAVGAINNGGQQMGWWGQPSAPAQK